MEVGGYSSSSSKVSEPIEPVPGVASNLRNTDLNVGYTLNGGFTRARGGWHGLERPHMQSHVRRIISRRSAPLADPVGRPLPSDPSPAPV
jgi:hypothetical protein